MKYRKKPIVVEAYRITEAARLCYADWPEWLKEAWDKSDDEIGSVYPSRDYDNDCRIYVKTLEGAYLIEWDAYIIKGIEGELYPCRGDIFERTYEKVE
jgi:hypothetical protein